MKGRHGFYIDIIPCEHKLYRIRFWFNTDCRWHGDLDSLDPIAMEAIERWLGGYGVPQKFIDTYPAVY